MVVHTLKLALLQEETASIIDYRLVVDNHSLDYNPEENLKMIIKRIYVKISVTFK